MKNKVLSLFFSTIFLCTILTESVFAATTVNDDFTYDKLENNWTVTKSAENNGTSYCFKDLNKVLRLHGVQNGAQTATRKNFKTTSGDVQAFWGTVYVDMVFSLSNKSSQRIFRLQADSTGNTWAVGLVIGSEGRIYYENAGNGERIAADTEFRFEENREYNMRITANMKPGANGAIKPVGTAGTYDITIDGETVLTGLPFVHALQNTMQFLLYQSGEGNWDFKKIAISDSYRGSWTAADITEEYSEIDSLSSEDWVFAALGDNASLCSGELASAKIPADLALCLDAKSASASNWICAKKTFDTFANKICIDMDFVLKGNGIVDLRFMNGNNSYVFWFIIKDTGDLYYKNWEAKEIKTDITVTKNVKHKIQIYYDLSDTSSAIMYYDGKMITGTGIKPTSSSPQMNNYSVYVYGPAEFCLDNFKIENINELPVDIKVDGFTVKDKSTGKAISAISNGITADVAANIKNYTMLVKNPVVIATTYSEGQLSEIKLSNPNFIVNPGEEATISTEIQFEDIDAETELKIFIWDMSDCAPLNEAIKLPSEYKLLDEIKNEAIVSRGDGTRIAAVMKKAMNGESITIGAIGGSITARAGASSKDRGYADEVYKWWVNKFPNATVTNVNAGVGGTGSYLGVHRLDEQLLSYNPDFVIMDFAVNDAGSDINDYSYEQIIRSTLSKANNPGMVLLFMMNRNGSNSQVKEIPIGSHYSLPMVSFANAVWPVISSGEVEWDELYSDVVHPNDRGHRLAAGLIINVLEDIYANLDSYDTEIPDLSTVLNTPERFKNAVVLDMDEISPVLSSGWNNNYEINYVPDWSNNFGKGWSTTTVGSKISFNVTGKNIGIVYKGSFETNMGRVKATVDGVEAKYIDSYNPSSGVQALSTFVALDLEQGEHTVEFELVEPINSGTTGQFFGLCGLLVSD